MRRQMSPLFVIHRSFVSVVLVVTFVSAVSFRSFRWFRSFRFDGFVLAFRVLVHAVFVTSRAQYRDEQ